LLVWSRPYGASLGIRAAVTARPEGHPLKFKLEEGQEFITLQSLLKAAGLSETGGNAKHAITSGEVRVDGEIELRRGKKIRAGQVVSFGGQDVTVVS
jgi:ribosome-associated protein